MSDLCPCGLARPYDQCCGRYIDAGATAPDPERLMRSRYTAFVRRAHPYLIRTWHPKTRPDLQPSDLEGTEWLGLEVLRAKNGFKKGYVEFKARYRDEGETRTLHEVSRFAKVKNRWVYQDELPHWPGEAD